MILYQRILEAVPCNMSDRRQVVVGLALLLCTTVASALYASRGSAGVAK